MIAFYILVILVCIALWFLLSFLYKPLGSYFKKIYRDSIDTMTKDDE